jgi:hypothetical protein
MKRTEVSTLKILTSQAIQNRRLMVNYKKASKLPITTPVSIP